MKNLTQSSGRQQAASELQLARFRVAKAESSVESAKEKARLAKRRRREARRAARRAKKEVKQAKAELAEAKQALADAERKLTRPVRRTAKTGKSAKARQPAKPRAGKPKVIKKAASVAVSRKVLPTAASAGVKAKRVIPRKAKPVPVESAPIVKPISGRTVRPITVPRDWEKPAEVTEALQGSEANVPTPAAEPGEAHQ